jgi:transposase
VGIENQRRIKINRSDPIDSFVPIKTEHQQEISCLHRIRERLIKNKSALSNQSRG